MLQCKKKKGRRTEKQMWVGICKARKKGEKGEDKRAATARPHS
jgi:hypothetical protein